MSTLLTRFALHKRLHYLLVLVFTFLGLTTLLVVDLHRDGPFQTALAVGEVSPQDIEAPRTLEIVNDRATKEARTKAYADVKTVFTYDPNLRGEVVHSIDETFRRLHQAQGLRKPSESRKRDEILKHLPVELSSASCTTLLGVPPAQLDDPLRTVVRQAVEREMAERLEEPLLEAARERVAQRIRAVPGLSKKVSEALTEAARNALHANFVENYQETLRARTQAMADVGSVKTLIPRGQIIVRKGDLVTPENMAVLDAFGLQKHSTNLFTLLGVMLFACLCIYIVSIYLVQQASPILEEPRHLWLLALLFVFGVGAAKACLLISVYFAPVITSVLLVAILLDYRLGLMSTALLALCVGFLANTFGAAAVVLLTGLVAVLSVRSVSRRSDLIVASVVVSLVNVLAVLACSLYANDELAVMGRHLMVGGFNGLASSVLAVGALPFLEAAFGVTTHIKLLELSNPSEPLLQRLMVEAPGTYHHSIIVANLAEAAAREIGADSLLAKVGAYYHDIGKMKAATFFVENQLGRDNPHDRLTPTLSAHIIISHVKDGMEMARQSRLPQVIADFIDMHHGDRLVSFFYHKALQRGDQATESDYRYHGRRPRSKETAIVMMADTIEAKARLLARPTQENLEAMVRESIKNIMNDGQLDESDLSLRDLQSIARALVKTLMGMYHSRIEYPTFPGLPTPPSTEDVSEEVSGSQGASRGGHDETEGTSASSSVASSTKTGGAEPKPQEASKS